MSALYEILNRFNSIVGSPRLSRMFIYAFDAYFCHKTPFDSFNRLFIRQKTTERERAKFAKTKNKTKKWQHMKIKATNVWFGIVFLSLGDRRLGGSSWRGAMSTRIRRVYAC